MRRDIHIHVEEPSMEAFLQDFLPKVLQPDVPRKIINHDSKWQLLNHVPDRLIGYANIPLPYRPRVLVLVDRDEDDCHALKAQLEAACLAAGLTSKSRAGRDGFDVVNRIVVEELEAWYFGDISAVVSAWDRVPERLASSARFRNPDGIRGGTHEAFLAVLQRAGHLRDAEKLPKVDTARRMGALLDPARNRSHSFQQFLTGLRALVEAA